MIRCLPLFLCLLLLGASCCPPCGYRYCTEGAQEFILDSYQINQGKFSILELEGECFEPLPLHLLLEYEDRIDEDDVLRIAVFHPTRHDLVDAVGGTNHRLSIR